MEIRKEIMDFAMAMEEKLRKNDHKRHWRSCSADYLNTRLKQEADELVEVANAFNHVANIHGVSGELRYDLMSAYMDEIVDMVNFCMMTWDNTRNIRDYGDKR